MSFGSPYVTLPDFVYHRPKSIKEAIEILAAHGDEAEIMAGGVGLISFMKERLMSPGHVVDVRGVKELGEIKYEKGRGLKVGAAVTIADVAADDRVRARYAALYEATSKIADPTIRKRATLVGNVCEAIPWVDSPPALISLGARLEIVGPKGARSAAVEDFIKGPVDVDLGEAEIVVAVGVPDFEGGKSAFEKFNAGSEFSIASVAASLTAEKGKRKARIVYGAVASTPVRCTPAEKIIEDEGLTGSAQRRAAETASENVECMSDVLATGEYRKHLIQLITMKALGRMMGK